MKPQKKRVCGACGEEGHIRTNKKKCPAFGAGAAPAAGPVVPPASPPVVAETALVVYAPDGGSDGPPPVAPGPAAPSPHASAPDPKVPGLYKRAATDHQPFLETTKTELRNESGGRCCICWKATGFAADGVSGAVNGGQACHIVPKSPAPNAPRGRGGYCETGYVISSARNGLWLCLKHAKEIDDHPEQYTIEELQGIKQAARMASRRIEDGTRNSYSGPGAGSVLHVARGGFGQQFNAGPTTNNFGGGLN